MRVLTPIRFGTDGWRGVIAEDFTFDGVRACAQGVALLHRARGGEEQPVVVGYDTRFASQEFAAACAEVLAGNGLKALLCSHPAPTPVVAHHVLHTGAAGAIVITASHNPARWNGFKYRTAAGTNPDPQFLRALQEAIGRLKEPKDIRRLPLGEARRRGLVEEVDPDPPYKEGAARLVDLAPLRGAGFRLVVDAMHGAGAGYLAALLSGGATQVRELRGQPNPAFPGMHNPEPVLRNLALLSQQVRQEGASVGLATDGDADRLGVVNEKGEFLSPLTVMALLAYYLLEIRGQRGPLVKSVTASRMLFRLGERYGVPVHETPVGFGHIAPFLQQGALMGGEESGGYGFRGHIPERDGVVSGLFFLDLLHRTGKSPSSLVEHLLHLLGPHAYERWDLPLDPAQAPALRERLAGASPARLGEKRVVKRDTLDGVRFHLEEGAWLILRPSGTEPLLRLYAEADTPPEVRALLEAGRALAGV
mgnify:CR=1 FL=1